MSYHLNRHDYHIFHTKIYDLVYVCVHCSVLCKYVHCGGSLASCSSLEQTYLLHLSQVDTRPHLGNAQTGNVHLEDAKG